MLNTTRIVQDWWRCKEGDERILGYVAACFHTLPRAVEIVGEYLMENQERPIEQEFLRDLFEEVRNRLNLRYMWRSFPDNELMYSILFAKEINWDETMQEYIYLSILLNSIEHISPSGARKFKPITSLTVLAGITAEGKGIVEELTVKIYQNGWSIVGPLHTKLTRI